MDVFPINHAVPFSKVVTFYKREPFQLTAEYNGDIPYPDRHIGNFFYLKLTRQRVISCILRTCTGTWTVRDIRPTAEGKAQKVKVKLRVNRHGIMTVSNALMYEAKESAESEAVEDGQQQKEQEAQTKQNTADGQTPSQNDNDAPMEDAASAATNAAPEVGSGTSWTKKISNWFSGVRNIVPARWPGKTICYAFHCLLLIGSIFKPHLIFSL